MSPFWIILALFIASTRLSRMGMYSETTWGIPLNHLFHTRRPEHFQPVFAVPLNPGIHVGLPQVGNVVGMKVGQEYRAQIANRTCNLAVAYRSFWVGNRNK